MDMPPPVTPVSQVQIVDYNSETFDEDTFLFDLSFIDSPNIPEKVKQFARDNDCRYLKHSWFWSNEKREVYSCNRNNKLQHIYDNGKKLRFAKWYELYKPKRTVIYQ